MATRLSEVKGEDWRGFRRVARYYERELRRIRNATAVDAPRLREFANAALKSKRKRHGSQ